MADTLTTRWYAVYKSGEYGGDPNDSIWTVSTDPNACGWETDSGFPGYGLSRDEAEFLAAAANEKIDREASVQDDKPSTQTTLEAAIGRLILASADIVVWCRGCGYRGWPWSPAREGSQCPHCGTLIRCANAE